jgi:hypothetical protein
LLPYERPPAQKRRDGQGNQHSRVKFCQGKPGKLLGSLWESQGSRRELAGCASP